MRLLVLTADYLPRARSGIGIAVAQQAQALRRLGIEVCVLLGTPPDQRMPADIQDEPFVHRLSAKRCPVNPREFDLIHLHSLALSGLALELRKRFGLPLIYTAHSLLHLELVPGPVATIWCKVQQHMLAVSDKVVFLSAAERAAAIELMPQLVQRSEVIANGVPLPPETLPSFKGEGPIVFAGRFARSKGIELLADFLPRLWGRLRFHMILAGGQADEIGDRVIRGMAARFADTCSVVGWLEHARLERLFARAALVLVPSLYEPFGLVALEAMRVGAPVLAAATGGLLEIVSGESGGWLVQERDPELWCEQAFKIMTTPALAREFRSRGPRYVAAHFNIERTAQGLRQLYTSQRGHLEL
jgi:1,4-alpha-glucan branching enzyme